MTGGTSQFLGLEKNPRAVPVAELVLWIGFLQWHFRTHGDVPPAEPILRDFHNIKHADALLEYTREEPERDAAGQLVTRWDGRTMKVNPITRREVPDESAQVEILRPVKPKLTSWPHADFIVGNPPFIAGKDLRNELGDGYAEALWTAYPEVPRSADIAMHFWWKAAQAVTSPKSARRFGFITSNSIRQTFCRRVISDAMAARRKLRLVFAIPDHPWTDGAGTAAVRIAMTVGEHLRGVGDAAGTLKRVASESYGADDIPNVELVTTEGIINADMTIGSNPDLATPLEANENISSRGMAMHGAGFIVTPRTAAQLGLGLIPGLERHIRPYLHGRDLTQRPRGLMVIDLEGLTENQLRQEFSAVYQHVLTHVKPERDQNNEPYRRINWWLFGRKNSVLRSGLAGLKRYIATVETAKHRPFCFLPANVIPDNMLVCIASEDAFHLGVLSSRIHVKWSLVAGGRLGKGNDPRYNKTRCFDPFPFPLVTDKQRKTIAAIAEELDALRRTRLDANPELTLTGLYNVLEKLRAGTPLTDAERDIHDAGHVSILKTLHDRLDQEVAAAYGWRPDLTAADIVTRIVALNAARRAEEERGIIHWLRPEYQAPTETRAAKQTAMPIEEAAEPDTIPAWPKDELQQYISVRAALAQEPATPQSIAQRFRRAPRARLATVLETLAALGQIHKAQDGSFYL